MLSYGLKWNNFFAHMDSHLQVTFCKLRKELKREKMKLFHKMNHGEKTILAPQTGRIISVEEIPDPAFSGKVLGDGLGIIPTENEVLAPVSGTVIEVADTLHAICLEGDGNGLEILIHLGLDTVKLKGRGFTCHVKEGQHVSAGDLLMEMDIEQIKLAGYNTVSPFIITNPDQAKNLSMSSGNAVAGKTVLMKYH